MSVRWRPSGGRGEWECVPSHALLGKELAVVVRQLSIRVPAEVYVDLRNGKPRLRKHDANDRGKLHLVPLVMAMARLPDPAREDHGQPPTWPLENKHFLISEMDFDLLAAEDSVVDLVPLRAEVLHANGQAFDLAQRFSGLLADWELAESGADEITQLILAHKDAVMEQVNSRQIRERADAVQHVLTTTYGESNLAPYSLIQGLPPSPYEGSDATDSADGEEAEKDKPTVGRPEGRILTRLHSYRERDPRIANAAKEAFKRKHGRLYCECCGFDPEAFYGERGRDRLHAHHLVPLPELVPDVPTKIADFAIVCPNCHDLIHARRPWLNLDQVREAINAAKNGAP